MGKSPSELYLNRQIRIQLDAWKPIKMNATTQLLPSTRSFSTGEKVYSKFYGSNKHTWKCGKVIKKFGQFHYLIQLDNGYTLKRHIDQLKSRHAHTTKTVSFQEDSLAEKDFNSSQCWRCRFLPIQHGPSDSACSRDRQLYTASFRTSSKTTAYSSTSTPCLSTGLYLEGEEL